MRKHGSKAKARRDYVEAVIFALREVARTKEPGAAPLAGGEIARAREVARRLHEAGYSKRRVYSHIGVAPWHGGLIEEGSEITIDGVPYLVKKKTELPMSVELTVEEITR